MLSKATVLRVFTWMQISMKYRLKWIGKWDFAKLIRINKAG